MSPNDVKELLDTLIADLGLPIRCFIKVSVRR